MNFEERFNKVAILGAAGKMGSGILLLIARLMATMKLENSGFTPQVTAIDVSAERLGAVMEYIGQQAIKFAKKNPDNIAVWYPGKNEEAAAESFAGEVLSCIQKSTTVEGVRDVHVVFEAVNENKDLKTDIFRDIEQNNPHKPFYLTNTSSVPIHLLDEGAGLEGRIIGFHFYNPPAVQKLVELISTPNTVAELKDFALELAKRLRKVVVSSSDVAGFIGNGHFMRDILYGFEVARKLVPELGYPGAMMTVDRVTRDYLIRPMGIFQLSDYVGLDVVQFIMNVMNPHFPDEDLHVKELDRYVNDGIRGGQNPDGSQKDGIFSYSEGRITGVYDTEQKIYIPVNKLSSAVDEFLGEKPSGIRPWKEVIRDTEKEHFLREYFDILGRMQTNGAKLAVQYGKNSGDIARKLVKDGVALSGEDVNTVLRTGFYHSYGPINQYFNHR